MQQEMRRQSILGLSPANLKSPAESGADPNFLNLGERQKSGVKILGSSPKHKNSISRNNSPSPTPGQAQIQQSIANYLRIVSGATSTLSEKFNAYAAAALPKIVKSGSVSQIRRSSIMPVEVTSTAGNTPSMKLSIPALDETPKKEVFVFPIRKKAKKSSFIGDEFIPKPKTSAFVRSSSKETKELKSEKIEKRIAGQKAASFKDRRKIVEISDFASNLRTFRSKRPNEIEDNEEPIVQSKFQHSRAKSGITEMAATASGSFGITKNKDLFNGEREKKSRKEARRYLNYFNHSTPVEDSVSKRNISIMAKELEERWGIKPELSESQDSTENENLQERERKEQFLEELEISSLKESLIQDTPKMTHMRNNSSQHLLNKLELKPSTFVSEKPSRNTTPTHFDSIFQRSQSRNDLDLERFRSSTQRPATNDLFTGTGTDFFKFNENHVLYQTLQAELQKEMALTNRTEKKEAEEKSGAMMIAFNHNHKIIQPAFMKKAGSMCCSEFWPKKFHVMLYGKARTDSKFLRITKPERENEAVYRPKKWKAEKIIKGKLVEQASAWTSKAVALAKIKEKTAHSHHPPLLSEMASPKGSLNIPRLKISTGFDTPIRRKDTQKLSARNREKDDFDEIIDLSMEPHEKLAIEEKKEEEEKLTHYERLKARRKRQELEDLLKLKIESNKSELRSSSGFRKLLPLTSRNEDRKSNNRFENSCPVTPRT